MWTIENVLQNFSSFKCQLVSRIYFNVLLSSKSSWSQQLNASSSYRPMRQNRRHLAPKRAQAMRDKVAKLIEADLIHKVYYPKWLSNMVLVKKPNRKWRMCIDYTDLNKACPKDSYSLPSINQLMDATSEFQLMSFMDAFSDYNQI